MAQHVFPDSLKSQSTYPAIRFSVDGTAESIYLPIPQGLSFGDNMNYSTIDLGIIGDTAKDAVDTIRKGGLTVDSVNKISGDIGSRFKSLDGAAAALIAAKALPVESEFVSSVVSLGARKILAPNTNALFQGSAIRQFGFQFKLVARTKAEAVTAKNIVDVFRKYMYPEGNTQILSYPNTWQITFHLATLPEIKQCFLTSLTTTYNSSTNAFYDDDAPLETDISVTFQETRALHRSDLY
jgi:hypothetical protein